MLTAVIHVYGIHFVWIHLTQVQPHFSVHYVTHYLVM